jgi:hypothetical protein
MPPAPGSPQSLSRHSGAPAPANVSWRLPRLVPFRILIAVTRPPSMAKSASVQLQALR